MTATKTATSTKDNTEIEFNLEWAKTLSEEEATLLCLPLEGRLNLQIPQLNIGFLENGKPVLTNTNYGKIPEDWFIYLKFCRTVKGVDRYLPKKRGFRYWSRKGYEENRARIVGAYLVGCERRGRKGSASDFMSFATEFYSNLELSIQEESNKLMKKALALRGSRV